jgi:uncharacterized membrane protein YesL
VSRPDKHIERSSTTIPFSVFGHASRLLWEELFLLGATSFTWLLFGLSVLALPPLTVGLVYVTNQVARGNAISYTMLFSGAWRFLGRSYIWGAINAFVILLFLADLTYYQQMPGDTGTVAVTLAILLVLAWSVVQLLTLPLLIELGPKSLKAAFRQALVLTISQPGFVIGLVIATALLALFCWFMPILIGLAFSYLALVVNVAVVKLKEPELDRQLSQKRPRASR